MPCKLSETYPTLGGLENCQASIVSAKKSWGFHSHKITTLCPPSNCTNSFFDRISLQSILRAPLLPQVVRAQHCYGPIRFCKHSCVLWSVHTCNEMECTNEPWCEKIEHCQIDAPLRTVFSGGGAVCACLIITLPCLGATDCK